MSATGATGPAPNNAATVTSPTGAAPAPSNVADAASVTAADPWQLKRDEWRKAAMRERHGGASTADTVIVSFPSGKKQSSLPEEPAASELREPPLPESSAGADDALAFLDDFFGADKRHLVAIKKQDGKTSIVARHFEAADRDGQKQFIADRGASGFDLYFSPNPIKGTLHKKAAKNDVVEARHLWIDLDPRQGEPLEAERAAIFAQLTTNLPNGMPHPSRVIDSGRGYWYWKLATPQAVDGTDGALTEAVECYGRGIEQAFGDRFADGCRNIDRIARLPGTINRKTGRFARVLHDFSHDQAHGIESFPRSVERPRDQKPPTRENFGPLGEHEPVGREAPELANLDGEWVTRIFEGDVDGKYQNDRSKLVFAVACELVRAGFDDEFIGRVLMTTKCGVHVQESAGWVP